MASPSSCGTVHLSLTPRSRLDHCSATPLDEALRLARPWTSDTTTGIEDVSDEEWDAFITALEQR